MYNKEQIVLDAAEDVFRKKGFQRATTEELAKACGYSVGTLYNWFSDKEGLYAHVLERLGHRLLARLESHVLPIRDSKAAIQALIRMRLYNYVQDRPFFQPFSSDGDLGVPDVMKLPQKVRSLYKKYFAHVSGLFRRALQQSHVENLTAEHLATCMEGMINAFMGYWSPPEQPDHQEEVARRICYVLLQSIGPGGKGPDEQQTGAEQNAERRIYISRFDKDRLKELLAVARLFGDGKNQPHLDALDAELDLAMVVDPRSVPPDLVTMNSRLLLQDLNAGVPRTFVLSFPKDAATRTDGVSILDALGTQLLGKRAKEVVEEVCDGQAKAYRIEQILYQPESAGDYHL
jgi:regulator of nucleoside diphosphate kinase